ncbi:MULTISPECIES: alpha/beta hydrolase [unclassified Streptomyces]|uniref:alpha/beta fold hydrolase n=1 Tax=unclassified Streptomyces TaxID=2593676 RepID=UPI002E8234ED|nr:alpha/beta hydrolase [Streptomyces sp. NBC_00562]WUC25643.1 alpha/beta hydrolase [Streptomyces sp. NBC_00562]
MTARDETQESFPKHGLVGHDRGARVGTRFAKDHRDRVDRFVAMDNIPTRFIAETYDVRLARQGYCFFTFLGVPDLPEALIASREEIWLTDFYRSWSYDPDMLTPEEIAVYVRAYQQPGTVRGSCMDYRAAPQDVAQDQEDADQLIDCPVLTMWGEDFSAVGQAYDVLDVWKGIARDVSRWAIAQCGHLCQEERPDVVNRELLDFLSEWNG